MSHLYERPGDRVTVYWKPDDVTAGKQAVENVTGETSFPVSVDSETAGQIRDEYQVLITESA